MSRANRARARNIALNSCSSVNMVQIIANSSMRGGTGEMPTSDKPLGVALTSINYGVTNSDWKRVIMHEFGHSFGGLWDEYWNGITPEEYPNITSTSDPNTVKWKNWIGYRNVGVYPLQSSKTWFRPHQNCMMKDTSNPFCPVCVQQLLNKMAEATGKQMFNTTNIDENNIKIDKMNLDYSGSLVIPDCINGRYVSIIGSETFKDCNSLTGVTIPSSVQQIDNSAFQNCENLSSVIVQRDVASITHLGKDVFKGCKSTLQITVPTNRVAEYKNKLYWSSYSSIIVPNNNNFTQYDLYDSSNHNITITLATGINKLYKLVVMDSYTYNITATSTANVSIKLYDSNMNYIVGSLNNISSTLSRHLLSGTYYYSVEYSNSSTSGIINTNIVFGNEQHLYEYKVVDSQYHILKCNCGATTGNKIRHTIDTTYVDPKGNGRYKPCVFCGAAIDTWEGGMYPGLLSDQIIYVLYEQRLGE